MLLFCSVAPQHPTLASLSVRERLARYGSSALSGVEHLRWLVGRDSAVDALLRHFGSLKELERASFQELRQFLTKREAEAMIAGLSTGSNSLPSVIRIGTRFARFDLSHKPSTTLWMPMCLCFRQ